MIILEEEPRFASEKGYQLEAARKYDFAASNLGNMDRAEMSRVLKKGVAVAPTL